EAITPAVGRCSYQVQPESHRLEWRACKILDCVRRSKKGDTIYRQYQAEVNDCLSCKYQKQGCPRPENGRLVSIRMTENAEVAAFREKMKSETARRIYQQRGAVAEFPNAWIKEKLGIRKFRLRGMAKATTEALWGALTYDVLQWVRLSWRPKQMAGIAMV